MIIVLNPSQLMNWIGYLTVALLAFVYQCIASILTIYCVNHYFMYRIFTSVFFNFFLRYMWFTHNIWVEKFQLLNFFFFLEELICYFLFYVDSWKTSRRSTHSSFRITDKITLILVKLPEFMGKNESNN